MSDMQGVGIGQHSQPIFLAQLLKKSLLVDGRWVQRAVPDLHKLLKTELAPQPPGHMQMPVLR